MDAGGGRSYSCGSRALVHVPARPFAGTRPADWRWVLASAMLIPAGGGIAYWLRDPAAAGVPSVDAGDLKSITDEIFDTSDNMFVFFLDSEDEVVKCRGKMQEMINALAGEPSLRHVRYYYNVRKEGDPPTPSSFRKDDGGGAHPEPKINVVLYKGQRKTVLSGEVPAEQVVSFFTAVSEDLGQAAPGRVAVPSVSGRSFPAEVLDSSSPSRPVLLQLYEDTCFLCFLMRPFVNSLARLFATYDVPLVVKRLNIEKNDFPDGCPVARGTPTFVCFRGAGSAPSKWDEFKPKELVEKISGEFPNLPRELYAQMDELQGLVSRRFQLFTQLVMWTLELQKLEALVVGTQPAEGRGSGAAGAPMDAGSQEDATFNTIVSEMMAKDMKRTDVINENLVHLQKEVDEVEHDAALVGMMLADRFTSVSAQKKGQCRSKLRNRATMIGSMPAATAASAVSNILAVLRFGNVANFISSSVAHG
eukprot:CAMPEP_0179348062 /NCGR_PEP_ID=MMETSP0797-20121207/73498_1 /TAXON_ID=47934 /ORGANISM="Dinophysis acuminata, Strain DAEP01" /LENGTH=474 /DNA_ID=CAMNT_0021062835 /DNA_START=275 /DNA_END=1697 /DNA_ORIENTATION=+